MLALADLKEIPDELANRMMMRDGSAALLRALRGEPEPEPEPEPKPCRVVSLPKRREHYRMLAKARPHGPMPAVVGQILDAVAEAFGIDRLDVIGKARTRNYVRARAVFYRLVRDRERFGAPIYALPRIAAFLGRDHSTACHALGMFDIYCREPDVREIYDRLRERFQ